MSLPRVVVDNSAMLPAFFPEAQSPHFDAGAVTNRARTLVHAIRTRRVNAFVPPSFFREFLNVSIQRLDSRGGRRGDALEHVRAQWEDLLLLPLITVHLDKIIYRSGELALDEQCPPEDSWYVAAATHAGATLWMSHAHRDGLAEVAAKHVEVRLLSVESPRY